MKINKIMLMSAIIVSAQQVIVCSTTSTTQQTRQANAAAAKSNAATAKSDATTAKSEVSLKTSGAVKDRTEKRTLKLSPTPSKVRLFFSEPKDTKEKPEVVGVEVTVCQGDCTGRTSMPYTKGVKEMQEKAEKIAQSALSKQAA